jgi:hypothetical protein
MNRIHDKARFAEESKSRMTEENRIKHTLASNFSQTCLRIVSYPPFFLKEWASPSIADLVADGRGRSEALNFRPIGDVVSGALGAPGPAPRAEDSKMVDIAAAARGVRVRGFLVSFKQLTDEG